MKFKLMKRIGDEWYEEGTYEEKNIEQFCRAYTMCSEYSDEVKSQIIDEPDYTRWVYGRLNVMTGKFTEFISPVCEKCNKASHAANVSDYNFCPHCGRPIRRSEDEQIR